MEKKQEKKQFYRRFFSIYVALVLQNVITLSVNLTDNIMLGAYAEASLSGVASVNQIQPMKRIMAAAMYGAISIALLLFVVVSLFPYRAVGLFTTDQGIIKEGVRYLSVIRLTYPLYFSCASPCSVFIISPRRRWR